MNSKDSNERRAFLKRLFVTSAGIAFGGISVLPSFGETKKPIKPKPQPKPSKPKPPKKGTLPPDYITPGGGQREAIHK